MKKQVTIHQAKTHLSRLIREALEGHEIIIARGNQPLVKLEVVPEVRRRRQLGTAKGVILFMAEDFDAPLEDFADYMP